MDCSPPGSSVHGILQARILEWVAMLSPEDLHLFQGLTPCLLDLLHWQANSLPLARLGIPQNLCFASIVALLLRSCAALCLVAQSCPILCGPRSCSPPGCAVRGVLQEEDWRGLFMTQGWDPGLLHCRQLLYHLRSYCS